MAVPSLFRSHLLAMQLILVAGLLGACNNEETNIAPESIPEPTKEQLPTGEQPPSATSLNKTYIETFSHEGLLALNEGNIDIAPLIKSSNSQTMTTLSSHQDNYVFSPYEQSQTLAMLEAGTGTGLTNVMWIGMINSDGTITTVPVPIDSSSSVDNTYAPGEGDLPLHEAMNSWDQQLQYLIDPAIWHRNTHLWGHENYLFLSSYLETLARYYGPEMSSLSFMTDVDGSTKTIGDWLSAASDNTLTPLMTFHDSQIGERTRVVTINTETLKAEWPGLFDSMLTTNERFKMLDGTMKLVPTMHATGTFDAVETDQYQAFQLPLKNSTLAILVIMPKEGEFETVQGQLSSSPLLEGIITALQPTNTILHLPRFAITSSNEYKGAPPAEGYGNFYDVNGQGYLYLKQKAEMTTIDVTESGINARAGGKSILDATTDESISVWNTTSPPASWYGAITIPPTQHPCYYPPQSRPFIFVIREATASTVLYAGVWTTPDGLEMEPDWLANMGQSCEEALNPPPEIIY